MNHDVFISFSFKDQQVAENLVNILASKYGISAWICTRDLNGGSLFKAQIPDAIDAADVVVFMQSQSSIESREVPKEIGIAFDTEKTIIPFRLDETPLKAELRYDLYGVEYIDATVPSFEERADELAQSILKALGRDPKTGSEIAVKPIYELMPTPFSCSEIFFGREAEMEALHEAFRVRNTVFLRGMGGIGKSEFARQYTRKYRSDYDKVIFARYDGSIAALLANDTVFNVKGLARKTNADGNKQSDEEYAAVKLQVLNEISDQRTLIILDNFDVTEDPMLDAFAAGKNYRLIVTSRMEPARGKYYVQPIEELEEDVLRDMVIEFANPQTTMIDRDDPDFPELFALTNRHTLTLELIGNFMEENCMDEIGEMVALLKKHQIGILENSEHAQRATAIRKLFRMTEMSEKEQNFLRWLALTPADGIGHKLFKELVGMEVFSARTRLAALSLVRLDGASKKISLHPIVRQTVYAELPTTMENSKPFFDEVKKGCYSSWNWPITWKLMISESSDVIMEQLGELDAEKFDLYYTLGIARNFVLPKTRVLPFWEKLYKFAVKTYGEDALQTGLVAYRAGWFCQYCDLDAMKLWLEDRAYPVLKSVRDQGQALVEFPHTITNIATCYRRKYEGDPNPEYLEQCKAYIDEALVEMARSYEEAVAIGDTYSEGKTYVMTAGIYMVQAHVGIRTGEYEYAAHALEKIKERITPDMPADYAATLAIAARLDFHTGEIEKAIPEFEDLLDRYSKTFPEINSYSMDMHMYLAQCMEKTGNAEAAQMHWEKAYRMADALLVESHPTLRRIREALGR